MDTVRLGFIGVGGYARHHLNLLKDVPEAKVTAMADPSTDQLARSKAVDARYADAYTTPDWREILKREDVDAVIISSPHTAHKEQVLAALDAGKHVLVDKPMVTSVPDALEVIAKRDATKLVAAISYQRHTQGEFRYMRSRIASGDYGQVQQVQALLAQEWKRGTKGSWRQDPALSGGGQLNDSGSHMLDILLWATGLQADRVSAICDFRGTPVDINSSLTIGFTNGANGSICIAGDAPGWHEEITVYCDTAGFYYRHGKLSIVEENGNRFTCDNLPGLGTPDRNFVRAILGQEEVQAPFECGLRVIELTEAAWVSAERGGTPVNVSELAQRR